MYNQPVYWKMRNGKLISVDEMDINHLRNVLKMIIRNRIKAIQLLEAKPKVEFKLKGDMANEFNESYYSDEDDDELEVGMTDIETGIL